MRKYVLVFFFFLLNLITYSQSEIRGRISDGSQNTPIPFASVLLISINDSSKIEYGAITDLDGEYCLFNVVQKKYVIKFSCSGYKTIQTKWDVPIDQKIRYNYKLDKDTTLLSEVEITSSKIDKHIDQTTYFLTEQEKKKAITSLDVLTALPNISIDNLNKTIKSNDGGSVKILINGISANEKEILSINPIDVIKIEHYSFPPAKYSGYSTVINYIIKEKSRGGEGGFDIQNAFSTGFGNDMVYYKQYFKNQKLSFQYNLELRDYKDRRVSSFFEYTIDSVYYKKTKTGIKSPFGYKSHTIDLSYSYKKDSNYVFQVKLSPNIFETKTTNKSTIVSAIDTIIKTGNSINKNKGNTFSPVCDLYFSKQLNKISNINLNVVGTGYYSKTDYTSFEEDENKDTLLFDKINFENNKQSIISEISYSIEKEKIKINSGFRYNYGENENSIINSFDNEKYKMRTNSENLYLDLIGKFKSIGYQITGAGSYNSFQENSFDNGYTYWSYQPRIILDYNLNPNNNFKLIYTNATQTPSLSELSSNKSIIAQNVINEGNPDLKPYRMHGCGISYMYNVPKFSLNTQATYLFANNFIRNTYKYENNYIIRTNENQKKMEGLEFSYSVKYDPLKSHFMQLGIDGSLTNQKHHLYSGEKINHNNSQISVNAKFLLKFIFLNIEYKSVTKNLDGIYLENTENYANIGFSIDANSFKIAINMFYPIYEASRYEYSTIENSIVANNGVTKIYDNGKMITLNLVYRFNFGKQNKDIEKVLNNQDKDSGGFK